MRCWSTLLGPALVCTHWPFWGSSRVLERRAEKPRGARAGVYALAAFGLNTVLARLARDVCWGQAGVYALAVLGPIHVLERSAGRAQVHQGVSCLHLLLLLRWLRSWDLSPSAIMLAGC